VTIKQTLHQFPTMYIYNNIPYMVLLNYNIASCLLDAIYIKMIKSITTTLNDILHVYNYGRMR